MTVSWLKMQWLILLQKLMKKRKKLPHKKMLSLLTPKKQLLMPRKRKNKNSQKLKLLKMPKRQLKVKKNWLLKKDKQQLMKPSKNEMPLVPQDNQKLVQKIEPLPRRKPLRERLKPKRETPATDVEEINDAVQKWVKLLSCSLKLFNYVLKYHLYFKYISG